MRLDFPSILNSVCTICVQLLMLYFNKFIVGYIHFVAIKTTNILLTTHVVVQDPLKFCLII